MTASEQLRHYNAFLKDYGSWLAGVMLYGGNSYEVPRDDAPCIADVYQNPRLHHFWKSASAARAPSTFFIPTTAARSYAKAR